MKWLLFVQTPYDTVKYITDELDSYLVVNYNKFRSVILEGQKIIDQTNLLFELDRFNTVFLNCEKGTWEVKKPELKKDFTFEELAETNKAYKEEPKKEKTKEEILLEKSKKYIDNFGKGKNDDKQNRNRFGTLGKLFFR